MSEVRVRTEQAQGFVGSRPVPLPHLLITATTSGAAQTLAVVRTGVMLKIRHLAVVNVTGSDTDLSLHAIPPSGTIGAGNAELAEFEVKGNTAVDLAGLVGGLYVAGTVLKAYAADASALVLHGWAEEVL